MYKNVFAVTILLVGISAFAPLGLCRELAYFSAPIGLSGKWYIWSTDGTPANTRPLFALPEPGGHFMASVNRKLVFSTAYTGQLWATDGTEVGTKEITVDGAPPEGVANTLGGFFPFNGKLYFRGRRLYQDANFGWHRRDGLWVTDGTTVGTREIVPSGADEAGVSPSNFTEQSGVVLFQGAAPGRMSLWRTDGSEVGTSEIYVDTRGTVSLSPHYLRSFNGLTYFDGWWGDWTALALLPGHAAAGQGAGLDPALRGVQQFYVAPKEGAADPSVMILRDSYLPDLWQTDGTTRGTRLLSVPGANSQHGFIPSPLAVLKGKLYLGGLNDAGKYGLWESDGTGKGTREIAVNGAGPDGLQPAPECTTVFEGSLYLLGSYDHQRVGLWRSDGSTAGTARIQVPGEETGDHGFSPCQFVELRGKLLFVANGVKSQHTLWVSDGTGAGTVQLTYNGGPIHYAFGLMSADIGP